MTINQIPHLISPKNHLFPYRVTHKGGDCIKLTQSVMFPYNSEVSFFAKPF